MALAVRLAPRAAKLWREGIALYLYIYFGHDHTVRQRQGLGVDLCAAYDPGIRRLAAVGQCILQGGGGPPALGLPI